MPHVQIRNVPDDVHRTLKARAAKHGMSLSDYLLAEMRELARELTVDELAERIRALPPVESKVPAAEFLRDAREERERELGDR